MRHKIPTILLGISTALIISMFFCNFATIIGPAGDNVIIGYHEKMPYLVMLTMLLTAHVAATASFKSPMLQVRVSVIAALLAVGFQIWLGVDFIRYHNGMTFSFTALFPLAAAFLDMVAARRSLGDILVFGTKRPKFAPDKNPEPKQ